MALVNHAKKEINAKLVYYGSAGTGKSAALHYIYSRIKPSLRGELKNIPAGGDNLQFFDFSPFEVPLAGGYRLRLHVYTLTGQVTNPATWKMTLKGADGLVIMLDPAPGRFTQSSESISELRELLLAYGVGLQDIPAVLQFNSLEREMSDADLSQAALALDLPRLTAFRSSTASGEGVLDVLTALSRLVLERVTESENQPAPAETADHSSDYDDYEEQLESGKPEINCGSDPTPAAAVCVSDDINVPRISISSRDAGIEGEVLRIPIDISCGGVSRSLVINVSVDSL